MAHRKNESEHVEDEQTAQAADQTAQTADAPATQEAATRQANAERFEGEMARQAQREDPELPLEPKETSTDKGVTQDESEQLTQQITQGAFAPTETTQDDRPDMADKLRERAGTPAGSVYGVPGGIFVSTEAARALTGDK